jgi:hypothetical protein
MHLGPAAHAALGGVNVGHSERQISSHDSQDQPVTYTVRL